MRVRTKHKKTVLHPRTRYKRVEDLPIRQLNITLPMHINNVEAWKRCGYGPVQVELFNGRLTVSCFHPETGKRVELIRDRGLDGQCTTDHTIYPSAIEQRLLQSEVETGVDDAE